MKDLETQIKICREEWFKNHIATEMLGAQPAHLIQWSQPDSWNYGCRLILHRRWLIVVGDIGEAVYEWSQDVTLPFLAGCDFHYFFGKCQASETGRKFTQWDSRPAAGKVKEICNGYDRGRAPDWTSEIVDLLASDPKDEFESKVRRAYEQGMDCEYASEIMDAGTIPNVRAVGHWVAVKMVHEQLASVLKK